MMAGMRFVDDRLKDVFLDIDLILFNRHDEEPIQPKDRNDFDPKHLYSVFCCSCKGDKCAEDGIVCKYYKGYIFGLGESEDEILRNHVDSGKRIAFKNPKCIDDSTDSDADFESHTPKKSENRVAKNTVKNIVWQNNRDKIIDKHKLKNLLSCHKKLDLHEPINAEIYSENAMPERVEMMNEKTALNTGVNMNENNVYIHSDDDEEVVLQVQEKRDDSDDSNDESENLEQLTKDKDCGYIKVYNYKLFKYLKREGAIPVSDRNINIENSSEPELYSEDNDKVYLGQGIRIGSLSWKLMQSKGDKIFIRELSTLIWSKKKLANRCLKLSRLNNIPGRSPVKLVSPKKLNHLLRLYRDNLERKKYSEDKIKINMGKLTSILSYKIRDLRQLMIERSKQRNTNGENE